MTPDEIGQYLVDTRRARGLTQRALGERVGLFGQTIDRYENTLYRSANLARIILIADALGVDIFATLIEQRIMIGKPREVEP